MFEELSLILKLQEIDKELIETKHSLEKTDKSSKLNSSSEKD
jgi:hypothetical protein